MNITSSKVFQALVMLMSITMAAMTSDTKAHEHEESNHYRRDDIMQILDACKGAESVPDVYVDDACLLLLESYFSPLPVWRFSMMSYFHVDRRRLSPMVMNNRDRYLPYTDIDFFADDVSTWGVMFGGENFDADAGVLNDTLLKVLQDDACRAIEKSGPIRGNMLERCHARELFTYATRLDACITGLERNMLLVNPQGADWSRYTYERSVDDVTRADFLDRESRIAELTSFHLHSLWMTMVCSEMLTVVIGEDLQPVHQDNSDNTDFNVLDFAKLMKPGHAAAMGIAARAGDRWAIHAYYPTHPLRDPEYWTSLREKHPLLLHR